MTNQAELIAELARLTEKLSKLQATPTSMSFAERVRALRTERSWSQRVLAQHAGVAHNTIRLIELGRPTSDRTIGRIANALSMSAQDLMQGVQL